MTKMLGFIALLVLFGTANCQMQYQTSLNFTEEFVKNNIQGKQWNVAMSSGAIEPCQSFEFIDGNDFKFTVRDLANTTRELEDRFKITYRTPLNPAKFDLHMIPGLLGAPLSGILNVYPLIATESVLAVATETGSKMVLVPGDQNVSYADIELSLNDNGFPLTDLRNITHASCGNNGTEVSAFQRFVGFFNTLRLSPQGTSSFFLPIQSNEQSAIRTQPINQQNVIQQTLSAIQQSANLEQPNPASNLIPQARNSPLSVVYATDGKNKPQAYYAGGYLQPLQPVQQYSVPNYYVHGLK